MDKTSFTDSLGFGYLKEDNLKAGEYTIKFKAFWTSDDVKDFTISVYGPEKVKIKDSNGKTKEGLVLPRIVDL